MPAVKGRSFEFLVDRRTGARLGFSLVNDSATAGQFTLIVRDRFNYEIDRIYGDIEAWSQVSRFADELLALPPNFVGTVELIGAGTESYAIGFEFTGAVFTTIQPVVQSGGSE